MSFDQEEFAKVAPMIVFGCNIGYGVFIVMIASFGLLVDVLLALIGIGIGAVIAIVAWLFLKPPHKNEGWLYAFILNIISIPAAYFLLPIFIALYPITFAILIIIIMIIPPIRKPYT
ncbi:MAG: hypothetical protein ACW98Y_03425 [Candidatus Thorarchaeota archaeon]|jgi:hypothetical protein